MCGKSMTRSDDGLRLRAGASCWEGFDKRRGEVQLNLLLILLTARRLNEPMSIAVPTGVMEGTAVGGGVGGTSP